MLTVVLNVRCTGLLLPALFTRAKVRTGKTANPSYSKNLEPEAKPLEPPEREVLFNQLDEDGVNRADAPEGYYAVKRTSCQACALFPKVNDLLCMKAHCMADVRADGAAVIFVPLGEPPPPKDS